MKRAFLWHAAFVVGVTSGCAAPQLARDGTLVFPEQGARGAAVLTANGVEFHDRADIPPRVVHRDAHDAWRAPIGFILPRSGRFTVTSRPTIVATSGLAIVLRPSDTRVPSWGGEVLMRLEVFAPASPEQARPPERFALVVDDAPASEESPVPALVGAALDALGVQDRISVVDGSGDVLMPPVPGRYRTLAAAAVDKHLGEGTGRSRPLAAVVAAAKLTSVAGQGIRRVVVLSDAVDDGWDDPAVTQTVEALAGDGVRISFIGLSGAARADRLGRLAMVGAGIAAASGSVEQRAHAVAVAIPPSGDVRFRDLVVKFSGVPAPTQVIEASGGDVRWHLDEGELHLGDISAGEVRAEVLRISVPSWVPGEAFTLHAETHFMDVARNEARSIAADVTSVYDEDIERIAESRAGDVIAFASALATLKRLDRAFTGAGIDRIGGLRALATMHARSMALLARDTHDAAIREQAEVLGALLGR